MGLVHFLLLLLRLCFLASFVVHQSLLIGLRELEGGLMVRDHFILVGRGIYI